MAGIGYGGEGAFVLVGLSTMVIFVDGAVEEVGPLLSGSHAPQCAQSVAVWDNG